MARVLVAFSNTWEINCYGPYAVCFMLNEFDFYLEDANYINDIIETWRYTKNSVMAQEERDLLQRDLNFLSCELPNFFLFGMLHVDISEVKQLIIEKINANITLLNNAIFGYLISILKTNQSIYARNQDQLQTLPNSNVHKYIQQVSFVNSESLDNDLNVLQNNQVTLERFFQILQMF